jgi:hypothetical protein
MSRFFFVSTAYVFVMNSFVWAGPFQPYTTSGVLPANIVAWASTVETYNPTAEVVGLDMFGGGPHNVPANGLGPADGTTVSLGDLGANAISSGAAPGSITVRFQATIYDGAGPDFAVFENAAAFFDDFDTAFIFAELAFVEVSTNGTEFARFAATSLNIEVNANLPDPNHDQLHVPFGRNFAGINTTNVNNLAGIHPTFVGTLFDLNDLNNHTLVTQGHIDLANIQYVRFVDIPGDGSFSDLFGNPILDTWHTIESGGFDLDAVGAIHAIPEPASLLIAGFANFLIIMSRKHRSIFGFSETQT